MTDEDKRWMLKHLYPLWIRGYEPAARMLGLTEEGLRSRVKRGMYQEGTDMKRKNRKVVLFNRDKLLNHVKLSM